MAPVPVQLAPPRAEPDEIVPVEHLDRIVETVMCNCSAGDDNPY